MKNKITVFTLRAMLFAVCLPADAQQPTKVPDKILTAGTFSSAAAPSETFRQSLRKLGYVEGKTILFDYLFARKRFGFPT